jgi:3D (Asp-Asp-Asp) domain-containing protein
MLSEAFAHRSRPESSVRESRNQKMRRLVIAVGLTLLCAPAVQAREQSMLARVTVYWASGGGGSDRWTRQHRCATGARLQAGHCAVDPRRIPYGSRVTLPDATLVAVDTGSAVVSRKAARRAGRTAVERSALVVDRFFETKGQALRWANQNPYFMLVRVSPPDFRSPSSPPTQTAARAFPQDARPQAIASTQNVVSVPRRDLRDRPKSRMYMP